VIEVVAGTLPFASLAFAVPLAVVLPIVLNAVLFNAGIENSVWSFVWRLAIVALSAIPGGLLALRWWREDVRWVEERDAAGHWIVRTFSAIERPSPQRPSGDNP
jgi:hypothetical protein